MPALRWSPRAAAVTTPEQREKMTALFQAFFRSVLPSERNAHAGAVLPLDLPGEAPGRYRFVAERLGEIWEVDARLRRPDLDIEFRGSFCL